MEKLVALHGCPLCQTDTLVDMHSELAKVCSTCGLNITYLTLKASDADRKQRGLPGYFLDKAVGPSVT